MTSLRRFALFLVAASLLAPAAGAGSRARAGGIPRPNVLIVFTDDQRSDATMVMPQLQKWIRQEGVSYPNTYVATPLCCPSRATIMTGRYAHNHGVVDNSAHFNLDHRTTLQYLLRQTGYRTAVVGKFFNGWPLGVPPPHFDRYAIFRAGYFNTKFSVDGKKRRVSRYVTDFLAAQAGRYLKAFEKRDGAPWLMYVTPSAPHDPFTPPPRYAAEPVPLWDPSPAVGEEDKSDKPPYVRAAGADETGADQVRAGQLRTLMAVDDLIGRLMLRLGELRERERTLVIFTSDNGYFWAEHGLTDKRLPYTEAIDVPLFIRWPGRLPVGSTDSRLVSLVDLAPTVLAAAGVAPDPFSPPDGRSLFDPFWQRDRVYVEYFPDNAATSIGPWASIRTREQQFAEYYGQDTTIVEFRELYDLDKDPYQLDNVLEDDSLSNNPNPAELQQLILQLRQDRSCRGTDGPSACP